MLYDDTLWKEGDRFVNGNNECEEQRNIKVQMKCDMFGALSEMFCTFNVMLYDDTLWKEGDRFVNGSNEWEEQRNIKVQMKCDMFGALSEMFFLSKYIRGSCSRLR